MSLDRTPARVGPWVLGRRLGAGGFGAVHEAVHDSHPDVRRAIKWIPGPDAETRARFLREAELMARVQHPGVVRVHEAGQLPEGVYLVLELVSGQSLRKVIEDSPQGLPLERACSLAIGIARGVGAAHALGVSHRDLKPENVLLAADGTPRVIDFGLAIAGDAERLTLSGMRMGTMGYMPPEQIDGRRSDQGPASDVFALGVVFYELVTGERPYSGTELKVVTAMARQDYVLPTKRRPDLPAWVDEVVRRALASRPGRRPSTGEVFARAIEAGLSGALTAERRRRQLRSLALAVLLLAGVLGTGLVLRARALEQRAADAAASKLQDDLAKEDLKSVKPERVAELAKARAALASWSGDAEARRRIADGLALLERRLSLRDRDEAKALAAAQALLADSAGLRARSQDVHDEALRLLVKAADADPQGWGRKLDGLKRTAGLAPAIAALRFRQARDAATYAERGPLLRRANEADAETFQHECAQWCGEDTPSAPAALDAAIDLGRAALAAVPASPALVGVRRHLAALRVARCERRRASDPRGVLEDGGAAAILDPAADRPLWYEGFVQRVVRRALDSNATPAEQAVLPIGFVELVAEDLLWGLTIPDAEAVSHRCKETPDLLDGTWGETERRVVDAWAQRFTRDYPDTSSLRDPFELREAVSDRLRPALRVLVRRSWQLHEYDANEKGDVGRASDEQARPPGSDWLPEVAAAAYAASSVRSDHRGQVPPRKDYLAWLDAAYRREAARIDATRSALDATKDASGAGDADLAGSLRIRQMRAASLRAEQGVIALETGSFDSPEPEELRERQAAGLGWLREAFELAPAGTNRRLREALRLVQVYSTDGAGPATASKLIELHDALVGDELWRAVVAGPETAEPSCVTDVARASLWFALAYLALSPPDLEKAEAERQRGEALAAHEFDPDGRDKMLAESESVKKKIEAARRR